MSSDIFSCGTSPYFHAVKNISHEDINYVLFSKAAANLKPSYENPQCYGVMGFTQSFKTFISIILLINLIVYKLQPSLREVLNKAHNLNAIA